MKPEVPRMRRFFFLPAEGQLYLQMYLPAAGVLCFAAGEIRHIVCINIKKRKKKKANENNTTKRKSNRVHRKR